MRTTDSDLELTKEVSPEQLRSLSTKVIEELIGALNIQKARLDSDIHDAQIDYRERKVYANPQWFKKAVAAAKSKGVQLQILHRELGDRRREEKREDALRYERTFMDVAKTQLKPEQLQILHRELGDRRREEKREDTLRYERTFMEVAKTVLRPEQYEKIVRETMLRCGMTPGCGKEF